MYKTVLTMSDAAISQDSCIVSAHCHDVDKLNKVCTSNRCSKRTSIVAHGLASFGGKATVMADVFASDMSTIAMESITSNLNDYWCHVDKYMKSGNINDLYCPLVNVAESIGRTVDTNMLSVAIASDDIVDGLHNCVNLSIGKDCVVDNNIHVIPVCECLTSICFSMEEHLLVCLGQACHDANAPLYLVDEIMDIIQDECEDSESMKHYSLESKSHW